MFTHTTEQARHKGCSRSEWSALSHSIVAATFDGIVLSQRGNRMRGLPG